MNKRLLIVCFVLFLLPLATLTGNAQPQVLIDRFEERTFRYTGGKYRDAEIKYRLHTPETFSMGTDIRSSFICTGLARQVWTILVRSSILTLSCR